MFNEFFANIGRVEYEGSESTNPLAFKFYNPDEKVGERTMRDHLRFSMAYWHTLNNRFSDPFGDGTAVRPWDGISDPLERS